jgi:hypothetical protein
LIAALMLLFVQKVSVTLLKIIVLKRIVGALKGRTHGLKPKATKRKKLKERFQYAYFSKLASFIAFGK